MPKIFAKTLADHSSQIWAALADALNDQLSRKTYDRISLTEVASAAGMARNTLYNYARDKQSLVDVVTEHVARQLIMDIETISNSSASPESKMTNLFAAMLSWVAKGRHRAIIAYALAEPWRPYAEKPLQIQMERAIFAVAQEGANHGSFRSNAALTLELLAGLAQAAALKVFAHPDELPRVLAEANRILLAALALEHD